MAVYGAGQVLADKYRLIRQLGRGGMGSVWQAEHLGLHAPVALKLIDRPEGDDDDDQAWRFLREARAAAALRSQHVVQILDYGVYERTPYIAMELLDGESLRARLDRVGRLALQETGLVVEQVARAVQRAHDAGIIHRDLKPENLFIVSNDGQESIKVLDFGIAKASSELLGATVSQATPTGILLGTPHYMSPEQARGAKSLDHRTDLWSLGIIACECLLGETPLTDDTLGSLIVAICSGPLPVPSQRKAVPVGFDAWFARACAREPDERFGSAQELATAFAQLAASAGAGYVSSVRASVISIASAAGQGRSAAPRGHSEFAERTGRPSTSERERKAQGQRRRWLAGSIAVVVLVMGGWWIGRLRPAGVDARAPASAMAQPAPPVMPTALPAPPAASSAPPAPPTAEAAVEPPRVKAVPKASKSAAPAKQPTKSSAPRAAAKAASTAAEASPKAEAKPAPTSEPVPSDLGI